jgi:hypothetical protein
MQEQRVNQLLGRDARLAHEGADRIAAAGAARPDGQV